MTFFSLSKQINVVAKFTKSTWKMTKMNQLLWLLFFPFHKVMVQKYHKNRALKVILNY